MTQPIESVVAKDAQQTGHKPLNEGVLSRALLESQLQLLSQKYSAATTLQDLLEDYVFFNHGGILHYGSDAIDFVADYRAQSGKDAVMPILTLPMPLFHGLGDTWMFRLLLCPREEWESLDAFLRNVSGVDRVQQRFFAVNFADVEIPDWFALARRSTLPDPVPKAPVRVYGITGNWLRSVHVPDVHGKRPLGPLLFTHGPPTEDIIRMGQAILAHSPTPFTDAERGYSDPPS